MNSWHLHPQLADDTTPVIELPLCEVRLMDDANHPWLVLVPRVADAVELIDLDPAQRRNSPRDRCASRVLKALFKPHSQHRAPEPGAATHVHVIATTRRHRLACPGGVAANAVRIRRGTIFVSTPAHRARGILRSSSVTRSAPVLPPRSLYRVSQTAASAGRALRHAFIA